jgi:hypothetical protein
MSMLALGAFTAASQPKPPAADPELAAIRKDIEAAYAPLEAVLKADKAFAERLSGELKTISAEKDPVRRRNALAAYASKYAGEYGKYADKAGLSMDKLITALSAKYTGYTFSGSNTYGIAYRKKRAKLPSKGGKPAPAAPMTRKVSLLFNFSRESDCGAVSGHYENVNDRRLEISNWSAVAGGCSSSAELTYVGDLPASARSIILRLGYNMSAEGSAVGVLGLSTAGAYSSIYANAGRQSLFSRSGLIDEFAGAPFLWAVSFESAEEDFTDYDITAMKGQRLSVTTFSLVNTFSAICCGTGATAITRFPLAELLVTD